MVPDYYFRRDAAASARMAAAFFAATPIPIDIYRRFARAATPLLIARPHFRRWPPRLRDFRERAMMIAPPPRQRCRRLPRFTKWLSRRQPSFILLIARGFTKDTFTLI